MKITPFIFSLALISLLAVQLCAQDETPPPAEPIDYWVAPNGANDNPGSQEAPFQTLIRARDQIRSDKTAGRTGAWTIHIQGGIYPITEEIQFTNEDSGTEEAPINYQGEPDAQNNYPLFSGGFEITGWKDEGDYWSADLPIIDGVPFYFEQLFVNDRRGIRAREPNSGFIRAVSGKDDFPANRKENIHPKNTMQYLTVESGSLDFMKDIPKEELKYAQAVIHHHWDTTIRIILDFSLETSTLTMKGEPQVEHNIWQDDSYLEVLNVRSAFDMPGEWFYDGINGKVLYRPLPGETIKTTRFIVPRPGLTRLLTLSGSEDADANIIPVTDITFKNLTFSHSDTPRRKGLMEKAELDPAVTGDLDKPGPSQFDPSQAARWSDFAVLVTKGTRITFEKCNISHIGEYGLGLDDIEDSAIENCDLYDLGAGGVQLTGRVNKDGSVTTNCCRIFNNRIREGGRFHASGVGVLIGNGVHDSDILHNDIEDFFYTGVSVGWTWGYKGGSVFRNRIEYNKIHKIGQYSLGDMGGIYTLGTLHGTRICNNVIYDVKTNSYGGWGIYTDEGSEGVTIENNLVYDTTDGSFHQHYGRGNLVRNNIFVNSTPIQVAASRIEPHRSFTFEKNIIYWKEGDAFGYKFEKVNAEIRDNIWFCTTGPALFRGKSYEETKAEYKKFDIGGMTADPLFADPDNGDYRLKPDSPALKLGFVPFDYTQAGILKEISQNE